MNQQKDKIYFATIARAILRLGDATKENNVLKEVKGFSQDIEVAYGSLIDEAEQLASGILSKASDSLLVPPSRMNSLLEMVGNGESGRYKNSAKVLSITKDFFPHQDEKQLNEYEKIVKKLGDNLAKLQKGNMRVFAENMLQLLFRYASAVPANGNNLDISLYDQTRTAAAIAVCLYEVKEATVLNTEKSMLLIGGDFSGIQNYIYQIVSKYAGKNLKGRSFYLKLLSEAVVGCLIDRLNLYSANIVYDSGGSFYLLAPNTKETKDTLASAIQYIEKQVFLAHDTTLYVAIDSIEVSKDEISNHPESAGLSKIWQDLFVKRDRKKQRRFTKLIEEHYADFFSPQNVDGKKRDAITGNDFLPNEKTIKFKDDQLISELNHLQILLGQELKNCDCLAVSDIEAPCWKDKVSIRPANLGRYYYLLSLKDLSSSTRFLKEHANEVSLRMLNGRHGDCDYLLKEDMTHCVVCLEFYGGNTFNERTFEEMCDNENLRRLGVLRMDVDNLGSIFQGGIPKEKASLARFAALSRSFDFFFSGYINSIVLKDEYAEKSFIIYSGGDDLFIVGEWSAIINIAKDIREDFRAYTCENPAFSISGGIAILTTKYPIIAGAEESALEESNAKNHLCCGKAKDSISFMDTPLNWTKELPAVEKLKDTLIELLNSKELPKSFLSKIILHASMADISHHKIKNMKTYWIISYDMKRIIERNKNEKVKQLALNCQKEIWENSDSLNGELITTEYHLLELWAFACRWAELEYRMLNN